MSQLTNRKKLSSSVLTIALGLLLVIPFTTYAGDKICEYCGKKISKANWIEFDGKYYHPDHFLCSNCGGDLKNGPVYVENGKIYDSVCYFELFVPKCDWCGEPIQGNYIEVDSNLYHQQCYDDHVGRRCAMCGEVLYDKYLIDPRGNTLHKHHRDEYPICEYCGCPIAPQTTGEGTTYPDGRHVCGLCLRSAVNDIKEAEDLMADIIEDLASYGIEIREKKIPLRLVDRSSLTSQKGAMPHDPAGYTSYRKESILAGVISHEDFEIFVLKGMPRQDFILTLGHELMHVWLFKNGDHNMSSILTEGSCQYAGILAISKYEDEETNMLRVQTWESRDPIYGDGLRRVEAYVREVGIHAWLEYLRKHKNPPWE
ncbi:MAG: protein DA1 [Candidatus Zixiibacteriota bacterium]